MLKKITAICLYIFSISFLEAQPVNDITAYRKINPWLTGSNPAGLIFNPSLSFAVAEGSYQYTSGNFRKATSARASHTYRICSEAFRQLQKIQLYGKISYVGDYQQQRQWSTTLQPDNHLLNLGDTLAGRQHCETYSIGGKIAIPLSNRWTIGSNLDYSARSNSKNSDPRNKNVQTDILFSPGVIFGIPHFFTGVNLIYRRTVEKITYSTLNQQIRDGRTFYPLWFYITEDLQNGTTNLRNYQEERYGGALQLFIKNNNFEWFNEIRYIGSTEKIDIYPTQNTKAGSMERQHFCYTGRIFLNQKFQHHLDPEYSYLRLIGYDYLQGKLDNTTSIAVETYGRIKRSAFLSHHAGLTYTFAHPLNALINRWSMLTGCYYRQEKTLFFVYPARFEQTIHSQTFTVCYERYIPIRNNTLDLKAQLDYTTGQGSLPEIHSENDSPLPEIKLSQNRDLLLHDFQIATSEQVSLSLQLLYTCPLKGKTALFGKICARHLQTLSLHPAMSRTQVRIATGLTF